MQADRSCWPPHGKRVDACAPGAGGQRQLLYNLLLTWGLVGSLPVSLPWALTSAKRRATMLQRLGLTAFKPFGRRDPSNPVRRVWVHALSVGEVRSAIPLVKHWRRTFKADALVFSTSTHTGYKVARLELGTSVEALFYYPYDVIFSVKRAIRRVAADVVVLVETDIWPNYLFEMRRRNVPVMLVNAKLSERSWRGYRRWGALIRPLFSSFTLVCAQTAKDAERFEQLGVRPERLHVTGNIKFDQALPPDGSLADLPVRLDLQPGQGTIVAGSTHPGEEALIGDAWKALRGQHGDLKLVVAPRDPARAAEIRRLYRRSGHEVMMLSQALRAEKSRAYDVLVVDRIGMLSRLYALADVAIVGGSLVPCGGHNPLEPAAWSKPIIFGADMSDFELVARMLVDGGGAWQVRDPAGLTRALQALFKDKQRARAVGQNAYLVFKRNQGTVARTINVISAFREAQDQ